MVALPSSLFALLLLAGTASALNADVKAALESRAALTSKVDAFQGSLLTKSAEVSEIKNRRGKSSEKLTKALQQYSPDEVRTCNHGFHDFIHLGRLMTAPEGDQLIDWADALVEKQWSSTKSNWATYESEFKKKTTNLHEATAKQKAWREDMFQNKLDVNAGNHAMKTECLNELIYYPSTKGYHNDDRFDAYTYGWHGGSPPTVPNSEGGGTCEFDDDEYTFSSGKSKVRPNDMSTGEFNLLARKAAFMTCFLYHPKRGIRIYSQGGVCANTVATGVANTLLTVVSLGGFPSMVADSLGTSREALRLAPRRSYCGNAKSTESVYNEAERHGCCWQFVHDWKAVLCDFVKRGTDQPPVPLPNCARDEFGGPSCGWNLSGGGISGSSQRSKGSSARWVEASKDKAVTNQQMKLAHKTQDKVVKMDVEGQPQR
eukprot:g4084.t1